jgi:N-carbamoylputrescine amidase
VQMSMSADADENVQKAVARVAEAKKAGADVVCLPELYRSPYFCQKEDARLFDLAEPVPGPSTEALGRAAKEAGVVVVAPIFERRALGLYHNTAAIIDTTGEVAGLYRKMHIPDDPAFYEKFYFTPGDLGFRAIDTQKGKIGTLICWDQWYPEGARLTALQGAVVLFFPTAIGWHPHEKAEHGVPQRDAWRTIQRGHAIANGVYVAVVNRVGHEIPPEGGPGLEFWGSSFVADPFGVVMAEASTDKEEILVAKVDLGRIEEVRRNWPFLRDRRIDAYGGIERRFID